MSYVGRKLRESRILFPNSTKGLIVPIDHGLTLGPIPGMQTTDDLKSWVSSNWVSAVLAHKGMIERLIVRGMLNGSAGVIVHLNGMPSIASEPDTKIMVSDVDTALQLGADAVSVQTNFTAENFDRNLATLGAVTDAAHSAGLPILVMLYDKVKAPSEREQVDRLHHLIRVVSELGADAIKLAFPNSPEFIRELAIWHARDIKIFFAGGEKKSINTLLRTTKLALAHGAAGLCAGRNVFQHSDPLSVIRRLSAAIQNDALVAPVHMEVPAVSQSLAISYAP